MTNYQLPNARQIFFWKNRENDVCLKCMTNRICTKCARRIFWKKSWKRSVLQLTLINKGIRINFGGKISRQTIVRQNQGSFQFPTSESKYVKTSRNECLFQFCLWVDVWMSARLQRSLPFRRPSEWNSVEDIFLTGYQRSPSMWPSFKQTPCYIEWQIIMAKGGLWSFFA